MYSLLLATLLTIEPTTSIDTAELLQFLAATQVQTSIEYDKLSYDVSAQNTSYIPGLDELVPISSNYKVQKRSGTILATWECSQTIREAQDPLAGGKIRNEISDAPHVTRMVKTPDYIAVWPDVASPELHLYFSEDWSRNPSEYEQKFQIHFRQVDIASRCFGYSVPFFKLFQEKDSARWSVAPFDPNEVAKIERMVPAKGGDYRTDLTLLLFPDSGLLREATFIKGDGNVIIDYTQISLGSKNTRVPLRYVFSSSGKQTQNQNETLLTFSNFLDESALPPFSLEQIGAPRGVRIGRVFPDSQVESRVWDGKEVEIREWRGKP